MMEKKLWRIKFWRNKFDSNNNASNECENERNFLNLLEFAWIYLNLLELTRIRCFEKKPLWTDQRTNGRTDKASYRDAWTHLKRVGPLKSVRAFLDAKCNFIRGFVHPWVRGSVPLLYILRSFEKRQTNWPTSRPPKTKKGQQTDRSTDSQTF